MAQRRMFSKGITNSDDFIDMPDSAQNLYFHLSMNADDDGFINNWKNIMRMTGHKEDDMRILIAKQYIIPFESGVIVIRHWRINNYLRNDRRTPTIHQAELDQLHIDDDVYELESTEKSTMLPLGIPVGDTGKVRLGKDITPITPLGGEPENFSERIHTIIAYMNNKIGCSYKPETKATQRKVIARLREGFSVEDFEKVIDCKTEDWGNDSKMREYLRPDTLFGTKFESYLQQALQREERAQNGNMTFLGMTIE